MARERLGGLHSAKLLLWSFDFAEIEAMQAAGNWPAATDAMINAAQNLEQGGAECLIICTNTMHKMAKQVQAAISIPLIHIADATAQAIRAAECKKPLLLATRYTMEQDFYKGHLLENHGIKAVTPSDQGRTTAHDIIYQELCMGVVSVSSKQAYLEVIEETQTAGIDGIIFGCTEVGLLISQTDFDIPCFDTTELHAKAALDYALS
jgi:aspartate racemase